LIEVAGAGHFELIDPQSSAWPVVKEAVTIYISGPFPFRGFKSAPQAAKSSFQIFRHVELAFLQHFCDLLVTMLGYPSSDLNDI
jgi:hypothetical protein